MVFGWLRVAEILNNPFGKNDLYDIDLAAALDLNIWKSSILIESQERVLDTDFAEIHPVKEENKSNINKNDVLDRMIRNDVSISV